jgi:hypothetical protein
LFKPRASVAAPPAAFAAALWLCAQCAWADGAPTQSCDVSLYPLSTPTARYVDNGDGTVTDKESKLMWMRCAVGQTWAKGTCSGAAAALTWQAALEAAQAINKRGNFFFSDWRVPQVPELAGIAERQCKNPRINLTVFPGTPSVAFWTATSRPSKTVETSAFVLGFGADGIKYVSKEETHDVRLVRTAP